MPSESAAGIETSIEAAFSRVARELAAIAELLARVEALMHLIASAATATK